MIGSGEKLFDVASIKKMWNAEKDHVWPTYHLGIHLTFEFILAPCGGPTRRFSVWLKSGIRHIVINQLKVYSKINNLCVYCYYRRPLVTSVLICTLSHLYIRMDPCMSWVGLVLLLYLISILQICLFTYFMTCQSASHLHLFLVRPI